MSLDMQTLFRQHLDAFASTRKLTPDMRHAAWCIIHCRTRELGGHVNSCPEGHYHQIAYNSCLHRCCPQCAWLPREKWLDGWKQRLLAVPHHHIVFTVPHQLNELWRYNKAEFANTLFAAASQTLSQLLADPKYLGGRPGILAALHTWNQKLDIHVHLHVLVTAGGLSETGQWLPTQKNCLLPRKVLMTKFRGKFKAMLREKLNKAKLRLPPKLSRNQFYALLFKLSGPWNVKIHEAYRDGESVATYLARYIKGGPMGNSRLIKEQDGDVQFRYRLSELEGGDGKRQGTTRLPVHVFLARWLEHVPPRRFQCVRGYGLYCGNQHSELPLAREALGEAPLSSDTVSRPSWQEVCDAAGMHSACRCPLCGAILVSHHSFQPGRGPPIAAFRHSNSGQVA